MGESPVAFLLARFAEAADKPALIRGDQVVRYGELIASIADLRARFEARGIDRGAVVLLQGDFSGGSVAALLAGWDLGAIIIPLAPTSLEKAAEFAEIGEAEWVAESLGGHAIVATGRSARHALYRSLRDGGDAGLVIFSSGSSGRSKGAVHAVSKLMGKFRARRKDLRTLAFLLFDHIAGLDTLLYCLSNTSTLIVPERRDPDAVCAAIAAHRVEVLPTAPSFLNLLFLSGAHARHDLSSLKIVTYGSEMMPQSTLERCADAFPGAQLVQKYGTSELGALRSQSRDNRSRWVRIGGEGYAWRVRDGQLEIQASSAMQGYLNAPSPFTDDGFLKTGDLVEVDGDFLRFQGRESDVINVGGQKVFPAEIEAIVAELDAVAEVAVFGEPSAILGAVVVCRVRPADRTIEPPALRALIRKHLTGRIEPYKIPQKFLITDQPLASERFKQIRRESP